MPRWSCSLPSLNFLRLTHGAFAGTGYPVTAMKLASYCVPWVLTGITLAQATHFVGTGGFAAIDAALTVAAPGDIVMVSPGTWPAFTATRAVTIRAVTPATAFIANTSAVNAAAGDVHLVDLDMVWLTVTN